MSTNCSGNQQIVRCACTSHSRLEAFGISPYSHAVALATLNSEQESVLKMTSEVLLDLICEGFTIALFEGGHQGLEVGWTPCKYDRTAMVD